ncbi:MAG: hypothetical protein DSY55_03840, partial [Clostridia bacterium]
MAPITSMKNAWSLLTELDTRSLREQVQTPFPIVILGRDPQARQWLTDALRTDPATQKRLPLSSQIAVHPLAEDRHIRASAARARLVIIVIAPQQSDVVQEQKQISSLLALNPRLPVVVTQLRPGASQAVFTPMMAAWRGAAEVIVDPLETSPFDAELLPLLNTLLPEQELTLGYHLPALRPDLARQIIRETSFANASYATTTGLAELFPALLVPGNMADFFVLTKNQALMAYKIALLTGHDIGLQAMTAELTGVLGGGFLWRETARRLVGFLPVWGLVPKVAVAYAGTAIIGEAAYHWYAHGEPMSQEQIASLYAKALSEGKQKAHWLVQRLKKEKLEP